MPPLPLPRTARVRRLPPRGTNRRSFWPATPSLTAAQAAKRMIAFSKGKQKVRYQRLDGFLLKQLSLTLGRRELHPGQDVSRSKELGPLPPGYHLAYFTPTALEHELAADGSDASFNAPPPFTRRMWAGGSLRWRGALKVDDIVKETTRVRGVEPKVGRDGTEMLIVSVEKTFTPEHGSPMVYVEDVRSWVFRLPNETPAPAADAALRDAVVQGPSTVRNVRPTAGEVYPTRWHRWSPVGLFRFSALTFNAHKIHYDPTWATSVEGHPACVVHGPLNLICMLDYWRDFCRPKTRGTPVNSIFTGCIDYKAKAPLYVGEEYSISAKPQRDNGGNPSSERSSDATHTLAVKRGDVVCMEATINAHFELRP
ncbi:putative cytoplasmic protein [Xylariomycetidae sp. FL0641]|nr:putative cytoplasmic protein [Xylariomycetidae sp. FL0641]